LKEEQEIIKKISQHFSKFAKKTGINPSLMRQYKTRKMPISEKQKEKILTMFHHIGNEFAALKI